MEIDLEDMVIDLEAEDLLLETASELESAPEVLQTLQPQVQSKPVQKAEDLLLENEPAPELESAPDAVQAVQSEVQSKPVQKG